MRVCGFVGSPRKGGSVDLLVSEVLRGARSNGAKTHKIYLNDLQMKPCQGCGIDPYPKYCIYSDDMNSIYAELESCDSVVLGSPVYFDTVSSQVKLMIDRCNCLMPYVVKSDAKPSFERRITKPKKGVFIVVGGTDQSLDPITATVRGFFTWANIEQIKDIKYMHGDDDLGGVRGVRDKMEEAFEAGVRIARPRRFRDSQE
jgi:multimeric flavodoxin WrbA